jgi:dihydroorotate dehydrogenase (NAD+) catalytic subunit
MKSPEFETNATHGIGVPGREQDNFFERPYQLGHKQVEGRFVIPSGIRCTHASTIAKCFAEIPAVGVVTTKSISLAPRAGYREPIYACYAPGCYINAVGLTNPGAKDFRAEFEGIEIPSNKFLLVSLFGGDVADFVGAAEILSPIADGFELNMSCPHAKGFGSEIGEDTDLVVAITRAVMGVKGVPVFVKLSATLPGLARTAEASVQAGAAGITVTNSIGPAIAAVGEDPILSNRKGGLSGDGIRPLGLRSVEQIREALGPDPIIIGMGGIGTAEHVAQFRKAGADLFGVGSALTGMDSAAICAYFRTLQNQLTGRLPMGQEASSHREVDMSYFPSKLLSRTGYSPGLFKIGLDRLPREYQPGELAGQYFFLWAPGVGEKPFAIFSAAEKTIIVRTVGVFTRFLEEAEPGTRILLRGPYGAPLPQVENETLILVGGGTGTASLLEVAYSNRAGNDLHFLLGARSQTEFFDLELFRQLGTVHLSSDDGSVGHHGPVTGLLREAIATHLRDLKNQLVFINCGPEPMVHASIEIQREFAPPERILGAIEYMTSCGVGICGKCASPSGSLSCIDGPFMPSDQFAPLRCTAGCVRS